MKTLKEYLKITDSVERLTEFYNDNGDWQVDYINDCPDFIDNYGEVLYNDCEFYYGELDDEVAAKVKKLVDNNNTDIVYDHCTLDMTSGIWRRANELCSYNIGEIEVQCSGLSDNDGTNCMLTELLKDMSDEDIKKAQQDSNYYVSDDCIYIDYSYDRISLILDADSLMDHLSNLKKAV